MQAFLQPLRAAARRRRSGPASLAPAFALVLALLASSRAPLAAAAPGEVWSAFFAFNQSGDSCSGDSLGAQFFVARFAPAASGGAPRHFVSQPYGWPSLAPIHSKTLTSQGGATMAADAAGRRAWALFSTTDWVPHTWVVQLAFPASRFNSSRVVGVCELANATADSARLMQGLTYSATVVRGGGAYFLNSDAATNFYAANVSVVGVPPLDPRATSVPFCTLRNVSTITSTGAFSPFIIPLPIRGTDRRGAPLIAELARSTSNTSQLAVLAWSALTGKLVYNVTWACGSPSYLYTCPPTSGGIPNGLNGAYLSLGTLFFGGGPWSSQQYFQASISALADREDEGDARGGAAIPVFTVVNASSNQATWLTGGGGSLFVRKAGAWPITLQFYTASGGTCVTPFSSTPQLISTTISADGLNVTSTPVGVGAGCNAGCPFLPSDISWYASAACASASFALPDRWIDGAPRRRAM